MGWQIVKNPETEHYQIFSSVVDAFILDYEHTREEIEEFWQMQFGLQGKDNFDRIMSELDKPDGKPYNQFTMTWEKAKMWDTHQVEHGLKSRQPDTCPICKENEESDEA